MKKKIAAFMGVIGSGKDYQMQQLIGKHGRWWMRIDFKDGLIDMCEDILGFEIRDQYELFKETVVGMTQLTKKGWSAKQIRALSEGLLAMNPDLLTGRKMLQNVGTETMRKRDSDYWVKEWARKARKALEGGFSVACADCRFINEVQAVEALGRELEIPTAIRFCDYVSDRYDPRSLHESEKLAQQLQAVGHKDGAMLSLTDAFLAQQGRKRKCGKP